MSNLYYRSPGIARSAAASPFVEAAAVDAWDAWFRWRDHGVLRDLTVDATWDRVAATLAAAELHDATTWKRRFVDAFSAWQLLPDERILATAGTGKVGWHGDALAAVLNVAAFVRAPSALHGSFDHATFEDVAALAVRALDNAAGLAGNDAARGFRIGIVGLADAIALLDLDYDGDEGRALAALVARSLGQGCRRASSQLAYERGVTAPCSEAWRARALAQEVATDIADAAERIGIRHDRLTAIDSQSKLALFANGVADALDPLSSPPRPEHAPGSDPQRIAPAHHRPIRAAQGSSVDCAKSVAAQLKLRAAMRRWIDEPIGYPLLVDSEPSKLQSEQCSAMAEGLGLPRQVGWRRPELRVHT